MKNKSEMRAFVDPKSPTIKVFSNELRNVTAYRYYKELSAAHSKPLEVLTRPEPRPANALPVKREALRDVNVYIRESARAKREGRILWIED